MIGNKINNSNTKTNNVRTSNGRSHNAKNNNVGINRMLNVRNGNMGTIGTGINSLEIRNGGINREAQRGSNNEMIGSGRNAMIANVLKMTAMNAKWFASIGKMTSSGMTGNGWKTNVTAGN